MKPFPVKIWKLIAHDSKRHACTACNGWIAPDEVHFQHRETRARYHVDHTPSESPAPQRQWRAKPGI